MNPDFPDELLSGLLDGELSPSERARVEQHLASHPADRQLLQELQALRDDLRQLPPVTVPSDFAQRVVQAALAAQPLTSVSPAAPAGASPRARWATLAVGVISVAAALLAGLWLGSRFAPPGSRENVSPPLAAGSGANSPDGQPSPGQASAPPAPPLDQTQLLSQALAATATGEALVVRLRVGRDFPSGAQLDAALAQAGLALKPPSDISTGASALAPAWRRQVQERLSRASPTEVAGTLATPSDALWIEASSDDIQRLVRELGARSAMSLIPEARLAARSRSSEGGEAEGEPGQVRGKAPTDVPATGPQAQHLPPTLFPLPQEPALPQFPPPMGDARGPRRVLFLIERVD
jgi:predicted anti-sigma-YlaC factor YlaD